MKTRVLRRGSVKGAYSPSSNHPFYGWHRFGKKRIRHNGKSFPRYGGPRPTEVSGEPRKTGACWRDPTEDKGSAGRSTPTKMPEEKIRIVTLCNRLLHKINEDIIQRICASVSCTMYYK